MKRLLIVFALLGRMFAQNPCAEHNIYLSESTITVGTTGSGSALCTPGTPTNGVKYLCPSGSGGMTVWGFDIQSPCVTNSVSYAVMKADSGNYDYDLGLYYIKGPSAGSLAGKLMVHTGKLTGTNFTPNIPLTTIPWVIASCPSQGSQCALPAGQYALALGTDCSTLSKCAILQGDDNKGYMYLFNEWLGGGGGTGQSQGLLPLGCPTGNPPSCTFNMNGLPASILPPATDPSLWRTGYPKAPAVLIF